MRGCLKAAVFGLAMGLVATCSQAGTYSFELGKTFNNTIAPTSSGPSWLTATFEDIPLANTVLLTLTSHLDVSSEFFGQLAFNIKDDIDPIFITVNYPLGWNVSSGDQNAVNLEGGGVDGKGFDFVLDLPTKESDRFNDADQVGLLIQGIGLKAADFNYANGSDIKFAAHVQGIPPRDGSGAIREGASPTPGVPDSGTTLMSLGAALSGLALFRRKLAV